MSRASVILCLSLAAASVSAEPLRNPALLRAAKRKAPAVATATNVMARPVRVASQSVVGGRVASRMSDGSVVISELRRATTARVTPSGRDLLDAELRAMADRLGADAADPRAVAQALKAHQRSLDELETQAAKSKGKAGALGALAGAALAVTARKVAAKKGKTS